MPSANEVIRHADGRVELRDHTSIEGSRLYSEDLAPVPVAPAWSTGDDMMFALPRQMKSQWRSKSAGIFEAVMPMKPTLTPRARI